MRIRGFIWWAAAVVFAGLAGILTYGLLATQADASASESSSRNMVPVVVATVDIPFRRSISEAELEIRNVSVESVPEGAATSLEQVVGKMSSADIFANQPVLVQELVTPDIVTKEVALSIPEGKIVNVVPTNSELVANRLIRPGDKIDLMATFDVEVIRRSSSGPMPASVSLLQNLEVHAIILPVTISSSEESQDASDGGVFRTANDSGQSVLLAVEPQDALAVRHVLDVGGSLDLALRAPGDDSLVDTKAIDQFYLADRYQIDLVRVNDAAAEN